jgi:hypothetical protein
MIEFFALAVLAILSLCCLLGLFAYFRSYCMKMIVIILWVYACSWAPYNLFPSVYSEFVDFYQFFVQIMQILFYSENHFLLVSAVLIYKLYFYRDSLFVYYTSRYNPFRSNIKRWYFFQLVYFSLKLQNKLCEYQLFISLGVAAVSIYMANLLQTPFPILGYIMSLAIGVFMSYSQFSYDFSAVFTFFIENILPWLINMLVSWIMGWAFFIIIYFAHETLDFSEISSLREALQRPFKYIAIPCLFFLLQLSAVLLYQVIINWAHGYTPAVNEFCIIIAYALPLGFALSVRQYADSLAIYSNWFTAAIQILAIKYIFYS